MTRLLTILAVTILGVACAETTEPSLDTGPSVRFGWSDADTDTPVDGAVTTGTDTQVTELPPTGCECPPKMHCNAEDGL